MSTLEQIATDLPIIGAGVLVIGLFAWITWVTLGVLERALQRHDRKDDDGPDRD